MSLHRRAARRDANEGAIIEALERCGWQCLQLSQRGIPDLMLAKAGLVLLAEIKGPKGKLTKDQIDFADWWQGPRPVILRTVNDVLILNWQVPRG
jgi:hypothetical protein